MIPDALVPDDFKRCVRAEVRAADRGARKLAAELTRQESTAPARAFSETVSHVTRTDPEAARRERDRVVGRGEYVTLKRQRMRAGLCASCGIPHDDETPGCATCEARHAHRTSTYRWDVSGCARGCPRPAVNDGELCGICIRVSERLVVA